MRVPVLCLLLLFAARRHGLLPFPAHVHRVALRRRDGPQLLKKSSRGSMSVGLLSARTVSSRAMSRGSPSPQQSPQTLQRVRHKATGGTAAATTVPRVMSTSELRREAASKLTALDSSRGSPTIFTFEGLDDE